MKALVTGCGGFAGSHLAEYLLQQGQDVVALVREQDSLSNLRKILPHIKIERVDIRDEGGIRALLQKSKPDRIYHLAAVSSKMDSFKQPGRTYDIIVGGTLNLLRAWHDVGLESRLLYVSSREVYGDGCIDSRRSEEERCLYPSNPYAAAKIAAELLALQFFARHGLTVVRVRPYNHTGPRQSTEFVCSYLAHQIAGARLGLHAHKIAVGNLGARRDFCDVRDIVRGYYLLMERGTPGEVYDLCSGRMSSIHQIVNTLSSVTATAIEVIVDKSRVRDTEMSVVCGNASKANDDVGWVPEYELEMTLRDLERYWEGVLGGEIHASQ